MCTLFKKYLPPPFHRGDVTYFMLKLFIEEKVHCHFKHLLYKGFMKNIPFQAPNPVVEVASSFSQSQSVEASLTSTPPIDASDPPQPQASSIAPQERKPDAPSDEYEVRHLSVLYQGELEGGKRFWN